MRLFLLLEYDRYPVPAEIIACLTVHVAGMKTISQSGFSTVSLGNSQPTANQSVKQGEKIVKE